MVPLAVLKVLHKAGIERVVVDDYPVELVDVILNFLRFFEVGRFDSWRCCEQSGGGAFIAEDAFHGGSCCLRLFQFLLFFGSLCSLASLSTLAALAVADFNDVRFAFRHGLLRCIELVDEQFERVDQVLHELELVVVHIGREVQEGLAGTNTVQLDGVLVGDQRVLLAVQEEDWALCLRDQIDVPETFVDDKTKETCPSKEALGCVFDTHVRRHQKQRVRLLA